jgi:hypothetical protein
VAMGSQRPARPRTVQTAIRGAIISRGTESSRTRRWRRQSRANPSLTQGFPELALIPERLWVILDRKSDVSCREMGPKSYRPQSDPPAGDYSPSRSHAAISRYGDFRRP